VTARLTPPYKQLDSPGPQSLLWLWRAAHSEHVVGNPYLIALRQSCPSSAKNRWQAFMKLRVSAVSANK
jgi:hypothetical protein